MPPRLRLESRLSATILAALGSCTDAGPQRGGEASSGDGPCQPGTRYCGCTPEGTCDAELACQLCVCAPGGPPSSSGAPESSTGDPSTSDATTRGVVGTSGTDGSTDGSTTPGVGSTSEAGSSTGTSAGTESSSGGSSSGGDTDGGPMDGWTRRREIAIDNPADPIADIEVLVELPWDDDIAPGFADLRFTDVDGVTAFSHHVEAATPLADLRVWVRVPALGGAGTTTIAAWYGNPTASSADDPAATFHNWEPFDGVALDPVAWVATGDVLVAGGALTISSGSVIGQAALALAPGFAAEVRMRVTEADAAIASGMALSAGLGAASPYARLELPATTWRVDSGAGEITGSLGAPWTTGPWGTAGVAITPATTTFTATLPSSPAISHTEAIVVPGPVHARLGSPLGSDAGAQDIATSQYDWFRVRRLAATTLVVTVGAEEAP